MTTIKIGDTLTLNGAVRFLGIDSLKSTIASGNWQAHTYPYVSDPAIKPSTLWGLNRGAWARESWGLFSFPSFGQRVNLERADEQLEPFRLDQDLSTRGIRL